MRTPVRQFGWRTWSDSESILAFAKLKAFLRAARPRTFDQIVELVRIAITLFTPQECANFVHHCGYRVSTAL